MQVEFFCLLVVFALLPTSLEPLQHILFGDASQGSVTVGCSGEEVTAVKIQAGGYNGRGI